MSSLGIRLQEAFRRAIQPRENSDPLRDAALAGRLGDWTQALTGVVVAACQAMGWRASARWHPLDLLPMARSEYLALDVMAFPAGLQRWPFPVAAFELENSREDDRIAYSLWKVLCVRAELRAVFCYRRSPDQAAPLVRFLHDEVVKTMPLTDRIALSGDTLVVVGSRDEAELFPYGFFRWWQLSRDTGAFEPM